MKRIIIPALSVSLVFADVHAASAQDAKLLPGFLTGQTAAGETGTPTIRSLRFVTTTDFPPFNYLGSDGKLNGFNVFLAKAICSELQIEEACTIQALPFAELQTAIERGQADAIIAGMAASELTRKSLDFSNAYLQLPARFVATHDRKVEPDFKNGLKGEVIGAVAGSAHEAMARAFFPEATVTGYATQLQLLAEVQSGKMQLAFGDAMALSFWLNGTSSDNCCRFVSQSYYSSSFLGEGMRIAVAGTRDDLADAINVSLMELQKKGVVEELYLRFFPGGFY